MDSDTADFVSKSMTMGWNAVRLGSVLASMLVAVACADPPNHCDPIVGQPTAERTDENIELLAAKLSPGVVADQDVYDRLQGDFRGIRELEPALADVQYMGAHDGRSLLVKFESGARARLKVGLYDDWDCLNRQYQVDKVDAARNPVLIQFKRIYDLEKVAQSYAKLPGVRVAEPNHKIALGTTRRVCVVPEPSEWHYIFQRVGDRQNTLYYFTSSSGSGVTQKQTWLIPESAADFEAQKPAWVDEYWNSTFCE